MKARRETILKAIERTEREMSAPYETLQTWRAISQDRVRDVIGKEDYVKGKAEERLEVLKGLLSD